MNFKWIENKAQFQSGESLYLNRIKIGSYGWNSTRSRDDNLGNSVNWSGELSLPSLSGQAKGIYGGTPIEYPVKSTVHSQVLIPLTDVLTLMRYLTDFVSSIVSPSFCTLTIP